VHPVLTLVLESRVTTRLYKYYYKETPKKENVSISAICWYNQKYKRSKAYVLADYLLGRQKLSDDLFNNGR
jgi:hypothetical protein